jgi:hypothetical protein
LQEFQILRDGRTKRRAVLQEPQHLVGPSFPADGEGLAEARIGVVGDTVEEEDLAEESVDDVSVYAVRRSFVARQAGG